MEEQRWWYANGRRQNGPVSRDELRALVRAGKIDGGSRVWKTGMATWAKAADVPEIRPLLAETGDGSRGPAVPPPRGAAAAPHALSGEYAGFWLRFVAQLLDALVCVLISFFVLTLFVCFFPKPDDTTVPRPAVAVTVYFLNALLIWLYNALMESSPLQATVGKLACGIMVSGSQGRRISFLRATGRHIAKFNLSTILLVGFVITPFNARKQALHDLIADTVVTKGRRRQDA